MNETTSVSRIIGIIDLGNSATSALCETELPMTKQKRVRTRPTEAQINADSKSHSHSFIPKNKVVVCKAHLSELMRHLERETHAFQRLYARAKTIERAVN